MGGARPGRRAFRRNARSHRCAGPRTAPEPRSSAQALTHLDTSFAVDLLRETRRRKPGPASAMRETLEDEELWISVHVACELFAGAALSRRPDDERQRILDFCDGLQIADPTAAFAQMYGRLLASLQRSGQTVGTMDLLIATAAMIDD
ncbi:MAG TPA: type II toxin-antitoxin system VapC family toxin, partial [Vicinamibacteria bacterium]